MSGFLAKLGNDNLKLNAHVIDCRPGFTFEDLADDIYRGSHRISRLSDLLVIRPPVDQNLAIDIRTVRSQRFFKGFDRLFERIPNTPVYILHSFNFAHRLTQNIRQSVPDYLQNLALSEPALLHQLMEEELRHLVRENRALLPAYEKFLYETPAGTLRRVFLRVGNVLSERTSLDAFFFWLLPHLADCRAILTETWSIGSVALNSSRLLWRYRGKRDDIPRVDTLSEYHGRQQLQELELMSSVRRLLRPQSDEPHSSRPPQRTSLNDNDRILVLVSASQTGAVIENMRATLSSHRFDLNRVKFVALYRTGAGEPNVPILCDLTKGFDAADFGEVTTPPGSEFARVVIDKRTYFPRSIREIPLKIRKRVTDGSKSFFDAYATSQAVQVHRTYHGDGPPRHHAIYIDLNKLLKTPRFVQELERRLAELPETPRLIISPIHDAGVALATLAASFFERSRGVTVPAIRHSSLAFSHPNFKPGEREAYERIDRLGTTDSILILDDVVITGGRLSEYRKSLRQPLDPSKDKPLFPGRIRYLVGVARPDSLKFWHEMKDKFGFRGGLPRHTLRAVETIVLPHWEDDECPWCRETRMIRSLYKPAGRSSGSGIPKVLDLRQSFLARSMDDGLTRNLFLVLKGTKRLSFGHTSIFVNYPADESVVFSSVASAMQRLRTDVATEGALLGRAFPVSAIVSSDEYLKHTFTDSLLRAAFFRAAHIDEVTHLDLKKERRRYKWAQEILESKNHQTSDLAGEIVHNLMMGKLPRFELSECARAALHKKGGSQLLSHLALK